MTLNKEKVSIFSIFVNLLLGGGKFFVGFILNSAALMADGIHSGLDVFSSFFSFLGIRVAKKPETKEHPYGFFAAETLGGLMVTLLLFFSGAWIIYEGITKLLSREETQFSIWGIVTIIIAIIVVELLARLKFKYGRKEESLALIADAEHSRADAISSVGVLIGFAVSQYYWFADGLIAVFIGFYILWESYSLGREVTDNLLGVKDEKAEEEIKKICREKNIEISSLKTRKIGAATFAEVRIKLDPRLRVEEAEAISNELQGELLKRIANLKFAVVQIESHKIRGGFVRPRWGGKRHRFRGRFRKEGEKEGGRGPGGYCFCPKCNVKIPHQRGVPCREHSCPKCGQPLSRAEE